MPKLKVANIGNCQNCKLPKLKVISVFLLTVNIFDELSWKLPKLQVAKVESDFSNFLLKVSVFDKLTWKFLKVSMYFCWIKLKIATIESCQDLNVTNWKWFICFLPVNSFDELNWKLPKLKVAKVESCQSWKFPILKVVAKVEGEFSISCQVAKLPSC